MSPLLRSLLEQAEQLVPNERLELISHLANQLRVQAHSLPPKRKWSDLKGMAPYPLMGEDAQAWVSRTRREGDEHREQLLQEED
jgi:hypothetical protein